MLLKYFFTLALSSFPDPGETILMGFFTGFYSILMLLIWLEFLSSFLPSDSLFGGTLLYGD